jgi:hypothetical protein
VNKGEMHLRIKMEISLIQRGAAAGTGYDFNFFTDHDHS